MSASPKGIRIRDQLLGQDTVLDQLSRARRENRLPHAIVLLGPRGVGKTRTALAAAQELLCPEAMPPCGVCPACKKVARLRHPDLHLLVPSSREEQADPEKLGRLLSDYAGDPHARLPSSASASIGIDQVRQLKESVARARVEAAWRVILVAGADRLTEQAAQSSLKLVEEPPADTVLFLTAEDASGLLPTLVSRCQRMRLKPLTIDAVSGLLENRLSVKPAEARLLASLSGGSLGRAVELKGESILEARERALRLFAQLDSANGGEIERRLRSPGPEWNRDQVLLAVDLLLLWQRDLLAVRVGLKESELAHQDRTEDLREEAGRISLREIRRRVRLLEDLAQAIEGNVNPELALHAALARTALPESELELL